MPLYGEAKREYQRKWVADRRAKWFYDKSCSECGSKNRLELHHVDPKLKTSHRIWSWSWERIELEVQKCIVLCEVCHAIESVKQLPTKLSQDQVSQIRERYSNGEFGTDLAKEYDISYGHIYRILRGERRNGV